MYREHPVGKISFFASVPSFELFKTDTSTPRNTHLVTLIPRCN